jgi:uncharacterized coiled-coil protein SlyX
MLRKKLASQAEEVEEANA